MLDTIKGLLEHYHVRSWGFERRKKDKKCKKLQG
jgi:hypothetical protein